MRVFYFSLILLALVPENLPAPGPVPWYAEAVPRAARATTEKLLVHTEGPGCSVQFLKAGEGVVLTNLELDKSVGISKVLGKPAFLELGSGRAASVSPLDPALAYCIEAVKRGKLFTPALRARFLGFGGIK